MPHQYIPHEIVIQIKTHRDESGPMQNCLRCAETSCISKAVPEQQRPPPPPPPRSETFFSLYLH